MFSFRPILLNGFRKGVSEPKQNNQKVYLDRPPDLRTIKTWFGIIRQDDCNLNDQLGPGRPSYVDKDALFAIMENKKNRWRILLRVSE